MSPNTHRLLSTLLLALCEFEVAFPRAVPAQSAIPMRQVAPPSRASEVHFSSILDVRQLDRGRVLVNDGRRRQLLILDAELRQAEVLLDSMNVGGQNYGPFPTPMIRYSEDSVLFVDGASSSLLLIGPSGRIVRAMAPPKPSDLRYLAATASGVDSRGNLFYRGGTLAPMILRISADVERVTPADSAPLLRANFETRSVDTVAMLYIGRVMHLTIDRTGGHTVQTMTINPLRVMDEWTLLSDGSVSIVRGQDYRVEIIPANGSHSVSTKLPFAWKRLSDGDKQHLVDSAQAAYELDTAANALREEQRTGKRAPPAEQNVAGAFQAKRDYVPIKDIADYWPSIRAGAVKSDLDGNVWILPTTSTESKNGELVYDVVNRQARLQYRVRLPLGRSIAGFGPDGVIYLMVANGRDDWTIERTRMLQPQEVPR